MREGAALQKITDHFAWVFEGPVHELRYCWTWFWDFARRLTRNTYFYTAQFRRGGAQSWISIAGGWHEKENKRPLTQGSGKNVNMLLLEILTKYACFPKWLPRPNHYARSIRLEILCRTPVSKFRELSYVSNSNLKTANIVQKSPTSMILDYR